MSADIHPLLHDQAEDEAPPVDLHGERSVYLDAYLKPFAEWLERDTVTEILVNRPGEVWVEDAALGGMRKIARPEIDDRLIQRLAEQVARVSHQGINREHPLLGATLPGGAGRCRRRRAAGRDGDGGGWPWPSACAPREGRRTGHVRRRAA